jgi:isoquinoline 1-oxidoreductase subunit beta
VGQGSITALSQILADELDVDWERVNVQFVAGKDAYKISFKQEAPAQKEGLHVDHSALRASAHSSDALLRAAAQKWRVALSECRTQKGFVLNPRGDMLSYGELAADAAKLPLDPAPRLKDQSEFSLIGKPIARLDTRANCNGSAIFGIDVSVPGMLNAAIK